MIANTNLALDGDAPRSARQRRVNRRNLFMVKAILSILILFIIDRLFTSKDWTRIRDMCVHGACLSGATTLIMLFDKPSSFALKEISISSLSGLLVGAIWSFLLYHYYKKDMDFKKFTFAKTFIPAIIILAFVFAYLDHINVNIDVVAFLSMTLYSVTALIGVIVLEKKFKTEIHLG